MLTAGQRAPWPLERVTTHVEFNSSLHRQVTNIHPRAETCKLWQAEDGCGYLPFRTLQPWQKPACSAARSPGGSLASGSGNILTWKIIGFLQRNLSSIGLYPSSTSTLGHSYGPVNSEGSLQSVQPAEPGLEPCSESPYYSQCAFHAKQ